VSGALQGFALVPGILPAGVDGEMLVGLGGTIRTLARIQRAAERRGVKGLKPERADIIVAGAVIVEELMAIGGYEHLTVSGHGVRHGVLVEETFGWVTSS
jgi:exopolyphosphatase/pppGpp-phosphohydrolase